MITLTINAINRLKELYASTPGIVLRIAVQAGGCSGFEYNFTLDEKTLEDDHKIEQDGVLVIIDDASLSLIDGSTLDFKQDIMSSKFELSNPQAKSGCGCGNSFTI